MAYQHTKQGYITQPDQSLDPAIYNWGIDIGNFTYVDHLSQTYLHATKELALICSEYKHLLCNHQKIDLLLTKLTVIPPILVAA